MFSIFYSWQSDLPGSKTRNLIRKCIDDAIDLADESEAIEAMRDEATTGLTGAPNIVSSLFSKIDNCDLFIADISLCYTCTENTQKKSPNPNVLLELGYAVKVLGWERVICICNTDFGDQYPFDMAHNRITTFTLENKVKSEVIHDLTIIIFKNIRDLRKALPRAKEGAVLHIVGSYDYSSQRVVPSLVSQNIRTESYITHNQRIIEEAFSHYQKIEEINQRIHQMKVIAEEVEKSIVATPLLPDFSFSDSWKALADITESTEKPVIWEPEKIERDKQLIKKWLNIDVSADFFDLGSLTQSISALYTNNSASLCGSSEEKEKYQLLRSLSVSLHILEIRTQYASTFDGMVYLPIAIQNVSHIQDSSIRVVLTVVDGTIILPAKNLIHPECQSYYSILCKDDDDENDEGIIAELFELEEDGVIHHDAKPYTPKNYIPRIPVFNGLSMTMTTPAKTSDDYEDELRSFIAVPASDTFYEFEVTSLRPNECCLLAEGLLIRPNNGNVRINYQIHSSYSHGDLSGTLVYKTEDKEFDSIVSSK